MSASMTVITVCPDCESVITVHKDVDDRSGYQCDCGRLSTAKELRQPFATSLAEGPILDLEKHKPREREWGRS